MSEVRSWCCGCGSADCRESAPAAVAVDNRVGGLPLTMCCLLCGSTVGAEHLTKCRLSGARRVMPDQCDPMTGLESMELASPLRTRLRRECGMRDG